MNKTIAVVGASRKPDKISHQAVIAFQQAGYDVFPINPQADTIAGIKSYPSLLDLPVEVNEISIYLPPALTKKFILSLPDDKIEGVQTIYFNPGSFDDEVKAIAQDKGLPAVFACSLIAHNLPSPYKD